MTHSAFPVVGAAILALLAADTAGAESPEVAQGRRIAVQNCGTCHAVEVARSPNPAAPRFRDLHRRYRKGGLDALLAEGMLGRPDSGEEVGSRRYHPRMPQVRLDEDEALALKAYLHSLEPAKRRSRSG